MRSCRAVGGSVVGGWQHLGLKTNFEKRNHRGSSMSGATRCRLLIHFSNGWKSFFCVLQHLGQQNNLAFCPKCRKLQQEMAHKSKIYGLKKYFWSKLHIHWSYNAVEGRVKVQLPLLKRYYPNSPSLSFLLLIHSYPIEDCNHIHTKKV